jgi:hypothetical protein
MSILKIILTSVSVGLVLCLVWYLYTKLIYRYDESRVSSKIVQVYNLMHQNDINQDKEFYKATGIKYNTEEPYAATSLTCQIEVRDKETQAILKSKTVIFEIKKQEVDTCAPATYCVML